MAFASAALTEMQRQATGGRNTNLPSAVNSGLVGVTTNRNNNSYHHSKNSSPYKGEGSYTNRWRNDLVRYNPSINRDAVTGSDRSQSRADMIKSWKLHRAVFDDKTDPRRKYFAEYIGTPDGVNAYRLDFGDGSVDKASKDHTWHEHEGWWYLYWDSWQAADASLSVKRGETKAQYKARHGIDVPQSTVEDEEMLYFARVDGKASVWKGNGAAGSLMAYRAEEPWRLQGGNATKVFKTAVEVVSYCGTLPGDVMGDASITAVEGAS